MIEFLTYENIIFLLQGAGKSLLLATCALFFGLILGVLGAAAKISKNRFLRILGNLYVEIIRGTPMLLQILFLYIAFPVMRSSGAITASISAFCGKRLQGSLIWI